MIANRAIYSLEAILLILFFFVEIVPPASLNQDRVPTQENVLFAGVEGEKVRKTAQRQQWAAQSLELKLLTAINPKPTTLQIYAPHAPISIFSNDEFVSLGFPGSGTFDDPYRIEGLNITNATRPLIEIRNTTTYFRINMNFLNGSNNAARGIYFDNVTHGIIEKNSIVSNREGILLKKSDFNTIRYNNVSCSGGYGVRLDGFVNLGTADSDNNLVKWNNFIGNQRRCVVGNPAICQAFDGGKDNLFTYNYWDDWTQPDADENGIVDEPYQINSPYGPFNQDPFPLSSSFNFADSDGDGMDDSYEVDNGLNPLVNDAGLDFDQDGLTNLEEYQWGTKADDPDTDTDGLTDGPEVNDYQTNPLKADTDEDGLTDYVEINDYQTNPLKGDTDEDGLTDGAEVNGHQTNPLKGDTDEDGLTDGAEVKNYHTDPNDPDTDDDFFPDGLDYGWWGNPRALWDNILTRALLMSFLLLMTVWMGFIAYQRPKLQQELQRQLQELQWQTRQLQEITNTFNSVESLQELGEASKTVYQQFNICKKTIDFSRHHHHVAGKWLPPFLRPDLTSLETIASSVNHIYSQFTQEYLRRVEEIIYE